MSEVLFMEAIILGCVATVLCRIASSFIQCGVEIVWALHKRRQVDVLQYGSLLFTGCQLVVCCVVLFSIYDDVNSFEVIQTATTIFFEMFMFLLLICLVITGILRMKRLMDTEVLEYDPDSE